MKRPLLHLAYKSLTNRRLTSGLTVASISLSVALLFGVEKVRVGARESFTNSISGVDLIVGGRGGSIPLLLYTVFRIGNATNNISYPTYEAFKNHPATDWVIPYSLGDSHRGYRVVGTNESFYERYRYYGDRRITFASGERPTKVFDVAVGSEAATRLGYKVGDPVVVAHGVTDGAAFLDHADKPFKIIGILAATGTPIDRSIYITLEGMEAIHLDWADGGPPLPGQGISSADLAAREKIEIGQITSFFLRTKSRIETLRLQREINTYENEPLLAIIPGVALRELWENINYAEVGLRIISGFVVVMGFLGMTIALYSSVNERRREMAILRALGFHGRDILFLLVFEALLLTVWGIGIGVATTYITVSLGQPLIQNFTGLYIPIRGLTEPELIFVAALLGCSLLVGLVPAYRAYRNSLADGLVIRV